MRTVRRRIARLSRQKRYHKRTLAAYRRAHGKAYRQRRKVRQLARKAHRHASRAKHMKLRSTVMKKESKAYNKHRYEARLKLTRLLMAKEAGLRKGKKGAEKPCQKRP